MGAIELPRAGVDGARLDRAGEIIHCQPARGQRRGVGLDSNRALDAVNVHLRNARQDVDTLRDNGGRVFVEIPVCHRV